MTARPTIGTPCPRRLLILSDAASWLNPYLEDLILADPGGAGAGRLPVTPIEAAERVDSGTIDPPTG